MNNIKEMKNKSKVGFPSIGDLTPIFCDYLQSLNLDVIPPLQITEKTIQLGVKNSPDMICFPYKVTLGNMIELAELGADIILQWNAGADTLCRQKQYYRLQSYKLNRLGYKCKVVGLSPKSLIKELSKISGLSKWKVYQITKKWMRKAKEENSISKVWSSDKPNIGIIGEVFCCVEPTSNRNLLSLIKKHGGNPFTTATVMDYLKSENERTSWLYKILNLFKQDKYLIKAEEFFEGMFAGHACENIKHLLELIDRNIDGIIHVLPLSCMPESAIEEYVDGICEDNNIPLLRIPLDETNSPANVETRVETFIKLILRKKTNGSG